MENSNATIMKTYFESLATGNLKPLQELLSDDIIWHQPGKNRLSKTYRGREELMGLFTQFTMISEGSFRIDKVGEIMVNGDLVSAPLHFSARKPDGEMISMDGIDLMRIENGKIKEVFLFSGDQEAEDAFWGRA